MGYAIDAIHCLIAGIPDSSSLQSFVAAASQNLTWEIEKIIYKKIKTKVYIQGKLICSRGLPKSSSNFPHFEFSLSTSARRSENSKSFPSCPR